MMHTDTGIEIEAFSPSPQATNARSGFHKRASSADPGHVVATPLPIAPPPRRAYNEATATRPALPQQKPISGKGRGGFAKFIRFVMFCALFAVPGTFGYREYKDRQQSADPTAALAAGVTTNESLEDNSPTAPVQPSGNATSAAASPADRTPQPPGATPRATGPKMAVRPLSPGEYLDRTAMPIDAAFEAPREQPRAIDMGVVQGDCLLLTEVTDLPTPANDPHRTFIRSNAPCTEPHDAEVISAQQNVTRTMIPLDAGTQCMETGETLGTPSGAVTLVIADDFVSASYVLCLALRSDGQPLPPRP